MALYEYASKFAKICFCVGFLTNFFLQYMTVFHIKKITGTYRIMVVFFSMLGTFFSGTDVYFKPFTHNYNNAMVFFSLNVWEHQSFVQFGIALYGATYQSIIANIAIQFAYRYSILFKPTLAAMFDGKGVFIWIAYSSLIGALYLSSFYLFCQPDQFGDDYVK